MSNIRAVWIPCQLVDSLVSLKSMAAERTGMARCSYHRPAVVRNLLDRRVRHTRRRQR